MIRTSGTFTLPNEVKKKKQPPDATFTRTMYSTPASSDRPSTPATDRHPASLTRTMGKVAPRPQYVSNVDLEGHRNGRCATRLGNGPIFRAARLRFCHPARCRGQVQRAGLLEAMSTCWATNRMR